MSGSAPSPSPAPASLLVFGSINADIFLTLVRLPLPGETIISTGSDSGSILPGGKGANQAVGMSKLAPTERYKVHFCGRFGSDSHGSNLRRILKEEYHVDLTLSQTVEATSGQAYILSQAGGQNSIILVPAANHCWSSTLSSEELSAIERSRVILLQREIPERINQLVAAHARLHSIPLFLDLGGEDTPVSPELLRDCTFLTANETELARLTNMPTDTNQQVEQAIRYVRETYGIQHVLITLGSRGSMLLLPSGSILFHPCLPIPASRVVDTTGAGDCFRGAFALAYAEQRSWDECLSYATRAATRCIQVKGAMNSMPTKEEMEHKNEFEQATTTTTEKKPDEIQSAL